MTGARSFFGGLKKSAVALGLGTSFLLSIVFLMVQVGPMSGFDLLPDERDCYLALTRSASIPRSTLFAGSSRMRADVDPDLVASAFGVETGKVLNLGHSSGDLQFDALLVSKLSKQHALTRVVVELNLGSAKLDAAQSVIHRDASFHPLASGTFGDLWIASASLSHMAEAVQSRSAAIAAFDWTLLLKRKLVLAGIMTRHQFGEVRHPRINPFRTDRSNICFAKAQSSAEGQDGTAIQKAQKRAFQTLYAPASQTKEAVDVPDFLIRPDRATDRSTVKALVALAKQRKFDLAFVYLPSAYVPLPPPSFEAQFKREFGAPVLIPDRAMLTPLYGPGYFDTAHMNIGGSRVLTRWLANRLAPKRSDAAKPPL